MVSEVFFQLYLEDFSWVLILVVMEDGLWGENIVQH